MKSLLRPRWVVLLFLITGLAQGFAIATNDSKNLTSTDLGHHPRASFFERRGDPPTPERDLNSLLLKAKQDKTRLDTGNYERDNDKFHAPMTHITLPLGDQPWDMAIWDQFGSVVIVVVIQTRAIMIQIPFTLVQATYANRRYFKSDYYKSDIHRWLFGVDGCLTEFLKDPREEVTKDQRKFPVKDWSSDPIQVHVRTRKNLDATSPWHMMAYNEALDQLLTDLREALTKNKKLPNILPEVIEDLSPSHHSRFSRTLKHHSSPPGIYSVPTVSRGIVLSWIPGSKPSDTHFLELWDGAYSVYEPVYIALEEQPTGLYPLGVEPTPGNGEYGLDYENKGCKILASC